MTLNYRGVIFAFLLLILATNLEGTKRAKRKHKRSEERMKDDGASSPEESGSGKIQDKEDDVGSGNKTTSSSQDERGTEKTKGHSDDATKNKDKGNTTLTDTGSGGGKGKICGKGEVQSRHDQGNPPHSGKMGCSNQTQPTKGPTDDDTHILQATKGPTVYDGVTQPSAEATRGDANVTLTSEGTNNDDVTPPTEEPTDDDDHDYSGSFQPTEKPTEDDNGGIQTTEPLGEDDGNAEQITKKPTDNEDDGGSVQPTEKPTDNEDGGDGNAEQTTKKPTDNEGGGGRAQPTKKPTDNEDGGGGSAQPTEKPTDSEDDSGSSIQPTEKPTDNEDSGSSSIQPTEKPTDNEDDSGSSSIQPTGTTTKPPGPPDIKMTAIQPDRSTTVLTTEGTTTKALTTGTTEAPTTGTTKPTTTETSTTETTEASTKPTTTEASTTRTTEASTKPTTEASTTETTEASTEKATEGTTKRLRDGSAEKAKETLQAYGKNIDAKNRTQIQTVLTSFKKILSRDESTEPKLKDDILAVKLLENVGKTIASQLKPTQTMPASIGETTNEQVFGVVAMRGMNKSGFNFPDQIPGLRNSSSFPARINLPSAVLNNNTSSNLSLVFMIYTASSEMQSRTGNESYNVTGKVVLASMFPKPTFPFKEPVVITIQNPPKNSSKASLTSVCVYLVENSSTQNTSLFGAWSNKGCKLAYSNKSHSVCHCYHLTNFAILTRFSAEKIPKEHELALNIITYIGLSLSIFGCLATLFVHFMLPKLWTDRTLIHMNLVTALAIANIVFLFQKLPVVGSDGCTTLAFILLYFYLAAFSWMMLEGIHIYRMLVKVFESGKDPRKAYFAAGWGIPLLLVVITVAIFRDNVTSEYYCWLSATNGALWMFAGPVCLVIFVNTVMLLVVMRTSLHHHSKQDKHLKRSMAKTFCILLPVLGITWLIGLVTFNKDIIEMQYIFAIVNSLQGFFIFLFYVVFSHEVRREITHKREIWKTKREINDQAQVTRESRFTVDTQSKVVA